MQTAEKLISLVKPHPCLYNIRAKEYRNAKKKEMLWKSISEELNQSREATKVKWKNLKDGYTKYKKNLKCTTGEKKAYNNWVWAPYLQFLDDTVRRRPKTSNVPENITECTENLTIELSPCSNSPDSFIMPFSHVSVTQDNQEPLSTMPSKKITSNEPGMDIILQYLKNNINKDQDAVDLLFTSYAETFKNLKPRTQASIKLKLAQMFVEAELKDMESENELIQSPVYSAKEPSEDYEDKEKMGLRMK